VVGDGAPYRVELRWEASPYERSISNCDDAKWQRDVVAAVGLLYRSPGCHQPIPQRVVDGFNAWRAAEHAKSVSEIRSHPERYRNISDNDPLLAPPAVVRGAHYEVGKGWIVDAECSRPASAVVAYAPPVDEMDPSPQ